ncbi:hypothetical protein Q7Z28_04635, partial [Glaesserella parasuis]|nr:hypothetical protein [Glaesserella parasuis]
GAKDIRNFTAVKIVFWVLCNCYIIPDDSVFKVIWLAIKEASKKWTMPIQNWKLTMNRFMIDCGDRLDDHR